MSAFSYKATSVSGKVIKGTMDAPDERTAAAKLQEMGYIPMQILPGGRRGVQLDFRQLKRVGGLIHRVSTKDVMLLTQDLSALLKAGLPLTAP